MPQKQGQMSLKRLASGPQFIKILLFCFHDFYLPMKFVLTVLKHSVYEHNPLIPLPFFYVPSIPPLH